MKAPVIRISIGSFDAEKASLVERRLLESKAVLESGIRAMRGNLGYYAGVDRRHNSMTNVSIWASVADARQMESFQPMLDLAKEFIALGVRFERPILDFETIWDFA
jgi:hypothetical protein